MNLDIRQYRKTDYDDYAQTLLLTLPCDDLDEAKENVDVLLVRASKDNGELWVAESGKKSVGFMLLAFDEKEGFVEIDWLDIHPQHKKQSIGTNLVLKAESRARVRNCLTLGITTTSSNVGMQNFATQRGFEEFERIKEFWGEGTVDAVIYRLNLEPD